jgi:histidine triad (HIT) family protein
MNPSIFTQIINGEIPCHKVYEDELTFAFMDIHPFQPGHVLVVPKKQTDQFDELDKPDADAVLATAQKVSRALREAFGTARTVLFVMGYDVPHAHIHLIPSDGPQNIYDAFLTINERQNVNPNHDELASQSEKIRSNL